MTVSKYTKFSIFRIQKMFQLVSGYSLFIVHYPLKYYLCAEFKFQSVFRKKSIDEWALDYWLLQRYAKLAFRIYYKKITVTGLNNIPRNEAVILASNHQNALMDAMLFVCTTEFQNIFLARADIFKSKLLIRVLTYLNIMPIYRIRDGIDNVKRNDEVFGKTRQVLRNKHNPLVIFPEGNHGDKRRLRNLVKGLFRIAFIAQEDYKDKPGVKIIPVGVDYGHYQNFGSTLLVNIGNPIEVCRYYGLHTENPVAAINQLKDDYTSALRELMIDIQTKEYYDLYMQLRTICNDLIRNKLGLTGNSLPNRFKADKTMIGILDQELGDNPETLEKLNKEVTEYQSGLRKFRLRDWVLKKEKYSCLRIAVKISAMILLLPAFIFGWIHNIIPYRFTASRVKSIKDPQFHSSIKYVIGMVVFPIMYVLFATVLAFMNWLVWIKLIYILLMPVTGLFAFYYYIHFRKLNAMIRYTKAVKRDDPDIKILKKNRLFIIKQMYMLIDKRL